MVPWRGKNSHKGIRGHPGSPPHSVSIDTKIELQVLKNGEKTADLAVNKGPDNKGQEMSAPCPIIPHSRDTSPLQDDTLLFISRRLEITKVVQAVGMREGSEKVESSVKVAETKLGWGERNKANSAEKESFR